MINLIRHFRQISALRLAELALVAGVVMFVALAPKTFAAAGIYRPINYQGKLSSTGGVAIANGQYNMRFKVFSAPTGGVALWTETWNGSSTRVTSTGGLFSIALGSITTMTGSVDFNSDALYLQVEFDPGNDGTYEEVFTPRRRFASVPYAHNANTLDGLDSTQFLRSDADATASGTITVRTRSAAKIGIDIISNGGSTATGALRLSTAGGPAIVFGSGGVSYDTNLYRVSANTLKTDDALQVVGTLSGSRIIVSGNANISGALLVKNNITTLGTLSGYNLTVSRSASISGTLIVKTGITSKGSVSGSTIDGFGLGSCSGTFQKLLYNASTDKFECGNISTSSTFGTGNVLTIGNARYVSKQGDTMTGALVINITGGTPSTLGLNVKNTISGSRLIVSGHTSVSGSLLVKGALTSRSVISGSSIVSSGNANIYGNLTSLRTISGSRLIVSGHSNISGSLLVKGTIATRGILSGSTLTIQNSATISGATVIKGILTAKSTISGSRLIVSGHANISGSLLVKNNITSLGTLSGYNLTVSRSASISGTLIVKTGITSKGSVSGSTIDGFGLGSCSGTFQKLLYNASTDKFECGSIATSSTFGTGNVITIGDARYVRKSGDTMTGALIIDLTGGNPQSLGLNVRNTISGSRLIVSGHANISGSLLVKNNITSLGTLSGYNLTVSRSASISGTLIVKTGITSKGSVSGSTIDGFGLGGCTGTYQKLMYNASTDKFECGSIATSSTFGTGNVITIGDARYVRKSGDTMTGALIIDLTGGNPQSLGLNVRNTISGSRLIVSGHANISGSLLVKGPLTSYSVISGSSIVSSGNANVYGNLTVARQILGDTSDTVALPGFTWSGDPNTGMYRPAADTIGFSAGGVQRAQLNASEFTVNTNMDVNGSVSASYFNTNVLGVGTDNSGIATLHVFGGVSAYAQPTGTAEFYDGFDEASDTTLASHTPNTGTSWTQLILNGATSMQVDASQSAAEAPATVANAGSFYTADAILSTADYEVSTRVKVTTTVDDIAAIGARVQDANNMYLYKFSATLANNVLQKNVGGVWTTLVTANEPVVAGDTIRLRVVGNEIVVLRNQKIIASVVDTDIVAAGKAGMGIGNISLSTDDASTVWELDDFTVTPYVAPDGTPSAIFENGNVGIDTQTPGSKLSVSGSAIFGFNLSSIAADTGTTLEVVGILSGSRLSISNNANISGALLVKNNITSLGTLSGYNLTVSRSASISGTLIVKTGITSKGSVSGSTIDGFGLGSCNGATQKLLYNASTDKFECGTISASGTFSTGNVLTIGDARYVKKSGDTMTGTLVLNPQSGLALNARGTLSGSRLSISNNANISGGLLVKGNVGIGVAAPQANLHISNATAGKLYLSDTSATFTADLEVDNDVFRLKSLNGSFGDHETPFMIDLNTGNTTFSDAVSATYFAHGNWEIGNSTYLGADKSGFVYRDGDNYPSLIVENSSVANGSVIIKANGSVGIGTSTPRTRLEVAGSMSGMTLFVQQFSGAGLVNCDAATQTLRWNATTERFSCSTSSAISTGAVLAIGDARYVEKSGDTMTGALVINITGGNSSTLGLNVKNTISGSRLIVSGHANISGALLVKNNITSLGTLSGYNLTVSRSASISGTLIVKTGITSKGSVSGSTIDGFGLGSCNGTYQKLLYNASTDKFECGSISTSSTFGTGNVITIGDARYVRKSGDTMTGALIINITNGNINTLGLRVINTISGAILHGERAVTSSGLLMVTQRTVQGSGALVVEQRANSTGAYLTTESQRNPLLVLDTSLPDSSASPHILFGYNGTFDTALFRSGTQTLSLSGHLLPAGTNLFDLGSDAKRWRDLYLSGGTLHLGASGDEATIGFNSGANRFDISVNGDTTPEFVILNNGDIGIGTAVPKAKLDVFGTISGSRLSISNNANISGALLVKNNITTLGTLSGYNLTVSRSASISGTLIVKTGITSKGSVSGSTIDGFGLGGCTGTYQKLMYNSTTDKFECGTISAAGTFSTGNVLTIGDARYVRKSGDTMTGALVINITGGNPSTLGLNVKHTISGSRLIVSGHANISGSLLVKNNFTSLGTLSGYNLTVSRSASISGTLIVKTGITSKGSVSGSTIDGFGLGGCTGTYQKLIYNASTDKFECGSIATSSTFGTGNVLTIGDARYLKRSGGTMTGQLIVDMTNGALGTIGLKVINTISGGVIHADKLLSSSGTLLVKNGSARVSIDAGSFSGSVTVGHQRMMSFTRPLPSTVNDAVAIGYFTCKGDAGSCTYDISITLSEGGYSVAKRYIISTQYNLGQAYQKALPISSTGPYTGHDFDLDLETINDITNMRIRRTAGSGTPTAFVAIIANSTAFFSPSTAVTSVTAPTHIYETTPLTQYIGRVGIGLATPTANFEASGSVILNSANTNSNITMKGMTDSSLFVLNALSNSIGIGTASPKAKFDVIGTISGSRLSISNNANISGALLVKNNITSLGTLSGYNLTVSRSASISGTLIVKTGITSKGSVSGSTIDGFGLGSCNGSTQKLLYNATSEKFECGTISAAGTFSTGNVLTIGDARYVRKSGDTMTGALVISITGGNPSTLGLNVRHTISGSRLIVSGHANVSGSLLVKGALTSRSVISGSSIVSSGNANIYGNLTSLRTISGYNLTVSRSASISGALLVKGMIATKGILSGSTLTIQNSATISGATVIKGILTVKSTISGSRLIVSGHANISGSLLVKNNITSLGTLSGYNLTVSRSASISGTLIVKTGITSKGSVSGSTIDGFGLGSCNGATQKLLYNASTDKFECGTISASGTFSTGNVLTIGDARYVRKSGDTMTGTLVLNPQSGLALNARGTISGYRLSISGNANISGSLLVRNTASFGSTGALVPTATLNIMGSGPGKYQMAAFTNSTLSGSTKGGIIVGARKNNGLDPFVGFGVWDTGVRRIAYIGGGNWLTPDSTAVEFYTASSYDESNGTPSNLRATISGNGLEVIGNISGSSLFSFGLGDCSSSAKKLTYNNSTGKFSCQDDLTAASGLEYSTAAAIFVNQSGDTMTGALVIDLTGGNPSTLGLNVKNTMSGSRLIVSGNASVSGSLIVKNNISARGTLSGNALTIMGGTSYFVGNVGVGVTNPLAKFEVHGTISGSNLIIGNNANISGALLVKGNITSRGTLSGYNLTVSRSASISGTLIVKTGITSKGSVSGSTIDGFGLGSCNGANQKLLYNAATDKFECGTITAGASSFSTGNVLTIGDARYVRKSGDTMTGTLVLNPQSGLALNARGTISGALITQNGVGNNYFMGNVGIGTSNPSTALHVMGSIFAQGTGFEAKTIAGQTKAWLYNDQTKGILDLYDGSSNDTVKLDSDGSSYFNGGSVGIGTSLPKARLDVVGTISGSRLSISNNANISGALVVRNGAVFGSTGALVPTATLNIMGSGPGQYRIAAFTNSTVSGSTKGGIIVGARKNNGLHPFVGFGTWDTGSQRYAYIGGGGWSTPDATTLGFYAASSYNETNGTMSNLRAEITAAGLEVFGTNSGTSLVVSQSATISGSLLVKNSITSKGTLSGSSLYGFGLGDCSSSSKKLTYNNSTGKFSCQDDLTAGSGLEYSTAANIFVNQSGDTMTGALVIDLTGGSPSSLGLNVKNTMSGSRLIVSGHANISGALLVVRDLTTRGTLSGYNLTVSRSASISGTLIVKTGITSKGSVSGSTIDGFGLGSCNGATQKLLYNNSTDKFECGTISAAGTFSTGNVLTIGDARYVRKSGDTMTGTLIVQATMSGRHLIVSQTASFSGAVVMKTNAVVRGTLSGSSLYGFGLGDCSSSSKKLTYNNSTGKFSCQDDLTAGSGLEYSTAANIFVNQSGDTMTGALVIDLTGGSPSSLGLNVKNTMSGSRLIVSGHANISGALLVVRDLTTRGTLSGYNLTVSRSASISGTLIVKTGITSKGSVSGSTIDGFGLGSCNGATQKLLYNNSTDKFECGTISAAGTFSTGNVLTIGDARYVRRSGGTMTGQLIVDITGGGAGTLGLKVVNTISGSIIHAERTLTSSGNVNVWGNVTARGTLSGSFLTIQKSGTVSGALLVKGTLATKGILSGSTLTIQNSATISGATVIKGILTAKSTISGSRLIVSGHANISGALLVVRNLTTRGTLSGSNLTVSRSASISGTLLVKTLIGSKGILSGATLTIQNSATISGATVIKGILTAKSTISGSRLIVSGHTNISGALLVVRDITTRGTLSGYNLAVSRNATISGSLLVKTLIGSKGILSGATLTIQNSGTVSGALLVKSMLATKGILSGATLTIQNSATISGATVIKGILTAKSTISGSRLIVSGHANISGSLLVLRNITTRGTLSGEILYANKILSSSGILMVTQKQILGSGALVVDQRANSTGAFITVSSFTNRNPVLVLENNRIGTESPHIMFGYRGTFDVNMRRSDVSTLAISGSVIVENTLTVQVFGDATATTVCRTSTGMLAACSSSLRYKEDVQELAMGLDTIREMHAVNFKWKGRDERDFGFIAEEMELINPLLVEYNAQGQVQGVKYMQLSAILTNAVQALDARLLGITNDSGSILHARDLITSSGSLRIVGMGTFGSGILLNTVYTNGAQDVLTVKSNVGGSGNTVFRVNASGAVYSDSTFNSQGADYAEWFKSPENNLQPGDLVCVDVLQNNSVRKCARAGDPNLMGIVSTNPAFIGNNLKGADGMKGVTGYALVGLIGQVPAKVSLENGVIRPGDSLTSASVAGFARKAKAGESTVGVALEGYDGTGKAVINVLISRRNQSLTVETVEQKVLDSIAEMNLSDEIQQMVQSVSENLDLDDRVSAALDSELQSLDLSLQINAAIDNRLSGATLTAGSLTPEQISLIASAVQAIATNSGSSVNNDAIAMIGGLSARVLKLESAFSGSLLHAAAADFGTLSVRGTATFGSGMTVVGNSTIGPISISGTGVTIGSLVSSGSLKVMGPITVAGLAEFLGDVHIKGELKVSNRQAGFAVIAKTGTSVTVVFETPLTGTPAVNATPQGRVGSEWWIENSSMTGFTLRAAMPVVSDVRFSWTALSSEDPTTVSGAAASSAPVLTPFPVNALNQPLSSDAVWNGCIQGHPVLDSDGHPLSCARYHDGFVWQHPDLNIFFTYNPNHEPPIMILPEGYVATPTDVTSSSSSSITSSESSSSSSESSVSSSSSSESSVSSSASSESSISSSASSESSSSAPSEPEPEPTPEPLAETPPPTESADPAPAPTDGE